MSKGGIMRVGIIIFGISILVFSIIFWEMLSDLSIFISMLGFIMFLIGLLKEKREKPDIETVLSSITSQITNKIEELKEREVIPSISVYSFPDFSCIVKKKDSLYSVSCTTLGDVKFFERGGFRDKDTAEKWLIANRGYVEREFEKFIGRLRNASLR